MSKTKTAIANDLAILRCINASLQWLMSDDPELAEVTAIVNRKMFELQARKEVQDE